MAGVKLGLDCNLYRNTYDDYDNPTWSRVGDIRNVTTTLEKGDADVTTRANEGWRAHKGTLKDATIEFELLHNPDREASAGDAGSTADYEAFRDAFMNNLPLDIAVLDGDIDEPGSQGLRAIFEVFSFTRGEELENGVTFNVKLMPTLGSHAPVWMEVEEA